MPRLTIGAFMPSFFLVSQLPPSSSESKTARNPFCTNFPAENSVLETGPTAKVLLPTTPLQSSKLTAFSFSTGMLLP